MGKEEHAFRRIEKDIKAGKIPGVVVLMGREEYLVEFYRNRLSRMFINEATKSLDLVTLSAGSLTLDDIISNVETISMMSRRKVVCVPYFFDSKGKMPDAFAKSEEQTKGLVEYIKSIPEGALLILTADEPEEYRDRMALRKSPVVKAVENSGKVYDFTSLDGPDLNGFIDKRLSRSGKIYRRGIPSLIGEISGYGNDKIDYRLFDLDNDIKKLLAYVGDREEITAEDVRKTIVSNPENNIFAMVEAAGKNRKDEALRLLHNLLESGYNEFGILSMLSNELEIMLMAKELREEGKNAGEVFRVIKEIKDKNNSLKEYKVRKALEASGRFSRENLKRILANLYEVDENVKSGMMPAELALEFFIGRM